MKLSAIVLAAVQHVNAQAGGIGRFRKWSDEIIQWFISDLIPKKSEKFEFFKHQKFTQKMKFR